MAKLKNASGQYLKNSSGNYCWEGTLIQLSVPTNVSISGSSASWDQVTNASSYELFSDGVSIGSYTPTASA